METQPTQPEPAPDPVQELDPWNPWNLPSAPLPAPPPEEWPEREARFDEGLARLEGMAAG